MKRIFCLILTAVIAAGCSGKGLPQVGEAETEITEMRVNETDLTTTQEPDDFLCECEICKSIV
jgi:PBP1b-binding outer membrane lipoprotein LpoB